MIVRTSLILIIGLFVGCSSNKNATLDQIFGTWQNEVDPNFSFTLKLGKDMKYWAKIDDKDLEGIWNHRILSGKFQYNASSGELHLFTFGKPNQEAQYIVYPHNFRTYNDFAIAYIDESYLFRQSDDK